MKVGLWTIEEEKKFFNNFLTAGVDIAKLMYRVNGKYMAYYPKDYNGTKDTMQSRNSYIGDYTESWFANILQHLPVIKQRKLKVEIGYKDDEVLSALSPVDVAILSDDRELVLIFEVKMSIVNNYCYVDGNIQWCGDMTEHTGNPGLHRSDSVLKAIAKVLSIHAREFLLARRSVPIIVVTNAPPAPLSAERLEMSYRVGAIQGVWNVGFDDGSYFEGYRHVTSLEDINNLVKYLVEKKGYFFSGYKTSDELKNIILEAVNGPDDKIVERFLQSIRGE